MEFIQTHGQRLEAVVVSEEAKHGHGLLYVEVLNDRFKAAHVPLGSVPDEELKKRLYENKHLFDKIFFVLLKQDDIAMKVIRVNRAYSAKKDPKRFLASILEEPAEKKTPINQQSQS